MAALGTGRVSARQAGWLAALLFFGWLAFLLLPTPKPAPPPPPAHLPPPPPSRLVALGLPDNPDLDALPEIFAMYADKAEWENNRTIFAYWNPGSQNYSYYFEATRVLGAYRFKEISAPHKKDYVFDESMSEDCPMRFYKALPLYLADIRPDTGRRLSPKQPVDQVKPIFDLKEITLPPPELKLPPLDLEPKRK